MTRPDVRDDQHGTRTGYTYGCRCDECRSASRAYYAENRERIKERRRESNRLHPERRVAWNLAYYKAHPEVIEAAGRAWREANQDYARARNRAAEARLRSESRAQATVIGAPWEPHEDALLERISSNVAVASALGRTYAAVQTRRLKLRRAIEGAA